MRSIDLNVDLGEGGSQDAALIALASSANIACGGHAGDESTMRLAIRHCIERGVAIGAHPGYEDRQGFGRREMDLNADEVATMVALQIERLSKLAAEAGAKVHHVKPHGALYHQADRDPSLAAAVLEGMKRVLTDCKLYTPPAGALAEAGRTAGLVVIAEGFVDRRYRQNGTLVPRSEAGAVIADLETAVAQALRIASRHEVPTLSGTVIPLPAMTLCVHGDGLAAVELLREVRHALEVAGFTIRA